MSSIIKLEIQKKAFDKKGFSILHDFELEVQPGEKLSIIGESGVGKTSLLNIIGCWIHVTKGAMSYLIHLFRGCHGIH